VEMLILPDTGYESVLGRNPSILGWTACLGRAEDTLNRVRFTGENLDQQKHCSSNRNRNPNQDRNRILD
jgi:hypothetical protein